jgi:hypothetical protein
MYIKLLIGLAALALVGGGVYTYTTTKKDTMPASETASTSPMSLQTLLSLDVPQVCTFTDSQMGAETSGTVYVADGRARGDFEARAVGQTYHAHAIIEEETMYTWIDETKMAFALPLNGEATSTTNQPFDVTKNLNYICTPWTVDDTKFEKPALDFKSTSTIDVSANACAACDAVPEAYRAQCKAVAGC